MKWLRAILRKHREKFTPQLDFSMEIKNAKVFLEEGFEVHSTILKGEVGPALRRLVKAKNPARNLDHLGLRLRLLKLREVPALSRLQKRIFSKIPDKGYHSQTPRRIREDAKEFREVIRDPKMGTIFSVWDGKRLGGFFGLFIHHNPHTDTRAGFGLMLDFPFQGKGIVKTAYRLMLEEALRLKVKTFHGGTSQPAVLALGEIMGRKKVAYLLRYKSS